MKSREIATRLSRRRLGAAPVAFAAIMAIGVTGITRTAAAPIHRVAKLHAGAQTNLKFVYITPNPIGANSFLQLGRVGIERAAKKFHASYQVLESEDPTSREQNLRAAIDNGASLVVLIGFEFNDLVDKYAPQSPKTQFLIVDQCTNKPGPNVHCARFKEYEVNYLLGVAAGKLTKTNHIGAIGAVDIPFLHRYTDAFVWGAQHVNHKIKSDVRWVANDESGFADPAKAKQEALAMAANGDDQILAAASASNIGVFQAAQQKNIDAYGVDVNQCALAPGHVVDNAVKRVDVVMMKSINDILHHKGPQVAQYGLKGGGLTLSTLAAKHPLSTKCVLAKHPAVLRLVKRVRQQIISGKIKIKDPMAQH
jgi:basic membrane protein A